MPPPGNMASPSMSSTVRPASSTAARMASSVSWRPERSTWRPIADWPTPEMTARRSNVLGAPAHVGVRPPDGDEAGDGEAAGPGLEADVDLHADGRVLGRAAAQPAGDPHAGVVGELDEHDRVRHLEVGQPALVVDREAVDDAAAGDLDRRRSPGSGTRGRCPAAGTSRRRSPCSARRAGGPRAAASQNGSVSSVTAGGMPVVASASIARAAMASPPAQPPRCGESVRSPLAFCQYHPT